MDSYTKELTHNVSITAICGAVLLGLVLSVQGCLDKGRITRQQIVAQAVVKGNDPVRASCAYQVVADGSMGEACRAYLDKQP